MAKNTKIASKCKIFFEKSKISLVNFQNLSIMEEGLNLNLNLKGRKGIT